MNNIEYHNVTQWFGSAVEPLWDKAMWVTQPSIPFSLDNSTVLAFRVGSHSHGTHIPLEEPTGIDDTDLMLVVVPPVDYKLGLHQFETAQVQKDGLDVVVYEWGKWVRLLMKQNPNVIGTLWLEHEDIYPRGLDTDCLPNPWSMTCLQQLFLQREKLLSQELVTAFEGYAHSQLYKMTHTASQGYMGEKRKLLVEKYGYDVKNAAHLIRLLRMCTESLSSGKLIVRRPDAAELVNIKKGNVPLDSIVAEASRLFGLISEIRQGWSQGFGSLTMRARPDAGFANWLMVKGYQEWWG